MKLHVNINLKTDHVLQKFLKIKHSCIYGYEQTVIQATHLLKVSTMWANEGPNKGISLKIGPQVLGFRPY